MSNTIYIGIDGGGTRARALVVDASGNELARRTGGAGIVRAEDPLAAAATLAELARGVLDDARQSSAHAVLCCALAGAGRTTERETLRTELWSRGAAARVIIVGDAEAQMADAFGSDPGVLLVAGTGSMVWARGVDGAQVRVGGWGLLLGDEGSGYAIGLAALIAVARADDGRASPTALTAAVLTELKLGAADGLIGWGARASKADIAALAPLVLRVANDGDVVAHDIRATAVRELLLLVTTAARRARITQPQVALAGGLIEPGGMLRTLVIDALRDACPGASVREQPIDGARGAALIARTTPA